MSDSWSGHSGSGSGSDSEETSSFSSYQVYPVDLFPSSITQENQPLRAPPPAAPPPPPPPTAAPAPKPSKSAGDLASMFDDRFRNRYQFTPNEIATVHTEISKCRSLTKAQLEKYLDQIVDRLGAGPEAVTLFSLMLMGQPVNPQAIHSFLVKKTRLIALEAENITQAVANMSSGGNIVTLGSTIQVLAMTKLSNPLAVAEFLGVNSQQQFNPQQQFTSQQQFSTSSSSSTQQISITITPPNCPQNYPQSYPETREPEPQRESPEEYAKRRAQERAEIIEFVEECNRREAAKAQETKQKSEPVEQGPPPEEVFFEAVKAHGGSLTEGVRAFLESETHAKWGYCIDGFEWNLRKPKSDMFMSYKIDPRLYPTSECLNKIEMQLVELRMHTDKPEVEEECRRARELISEITTVRGYLYLGDLVSEEELKGDQKRCFDCVDPQVCKTIEEGAKTARCDKSGNVGKVLNDLALENKRQLVGFTKNIVVTPFRFPNGCGSTHVFFHGWGSVSIDVKEHCLFHITGDDQPMMIYFEYITFNCPVFPLFDNFRAYTKAPQWTICFKNCCFKQRLVCHTNMTFKTCLGPSLTILPGVVCRIEDSRFERVDLVGGHIVSDGSTYGEEIRLYRDEDLLPRITLGGNDRRAPDVTVGIKRKDLPAKRHYVDSEGNSFKWPDDPRELQKHFEELEATLRRIGMEEELNPLAGSEFTNPRVCADCMNYCLGCGEYNKYLHEEAKEPFRPLMCRDCRYQSPYGCARCKKAIKYGYPGLVCHQCRLKYRGSCVKCGADDPYVPYTK